ncbi:MAG: glycosyltransferase family 2 protein [Chloroflexota bacterium]|jgi:glycosyltransferase involved in cell wall biosynthesis
MKLSVIIPVYNEVNTIKEIVQRVKNINVVYEIIIVDDGSSDGTRDILRMMEAGNDDSPILRIIYNEKNQGKGSAVWIGIQNANGDALLIQDADLEYDPRDVPALIKPLEEGVADVVYGSRFLGAPHRSTMFWHMVANMMLTMFTNILYDTILTDMETGYKLFRREVVANIKIRSKRFDFEPEFTAKILKKKVRVFEVPISFNARDYSDGKKIGLKDAFAAVWALLIYRLID